VFDLAACRKRLADYERLVDETADGRLSEATFSAIGLATVIVAVDVPELLGALEAAHATLAEIRDEAVHPGLWRWCGWPGCWASFNADTGPAARGWIRCANKHLLLCPQHAVAGHTLSYSYGDTLRNLIALCACGETTDLGNANWETIETWWRTHVEQAGSGG
jgi:hypothetical protein